MKIFKPRNRANCLPIVCGLPTLSGFSSNNKIPETNSIVVMLEETLQKGEVFLRKRKLSFNRRNLYLVLSS